MSEAAPARRSPRKGRSSLSAATSGGTSAAGSAAASSSKPRLARRPQSVGGKQLQSMAEELESAEPRIDEDLLPASRRHVPGPRKSSIRTRAPQVFASPSGVVPSPTSRKYVSAGLNLTAPIAPLGSSSSINQVLDDASAAPAAAAASKPANMARSASTPALDSADAAAASANVASATSESSGNEPSAAPAAYSGAHTIAIGSEGSGRSDAAVAAARKRRVTFTRMVARTDFERDEPTMRIQPAGNAEGPLLPDTTSSSVSRATSDSDSDSEDDIDLLIASSYREAGAAGEDSNMDISELTGAQLAGEHSQSMEFTQALGRVVSTNAAAAPQRRRDSGIPAQRYVEGEDDSDDSSFDDSVDNDAALQRNTDDNRTQTMEFTTAVGGLVGLNGQAAHAETIATIEEEETMEMDESAMDMTQAFGAIQHVARRSSLAPPVVAPRRSAVPRRSRASVAPTEGDQSMAMDITQAYGAIRSVAGQKRAADETFDTDDWDDSAVAPQAADASAMDMTIAHGRINSPARPASAASPRKSHAPVSPHRFALTRPGGASTTPSKRQALSGPGSRPQSPSKAGTASLRTSPAKPMFAQPSPARANSPTKFRQSLRGAPSPGAGTQSPARRVAVARVSMPAAPALQQETVKPEAPASTLAPAVTQEARVLSAPSRKAFVPAAASGPSRPRTSFMANPAPEPSETSTSSFHSAQMGSSEPESLRAVSVSEFFALLGVTFHEGITSATRRQVEHPSSAPEERAGVHTMRMAKAAAGSVPMLDGLVTACRELQQHIQKGRAELAETETAFLEQPPPFVHDVLTCEPDARKESEAQCKLQKSAARAHALEKYYGWRLDNQFGPELVALLETNRDSLEADAKVVKAEGAAMRERILPALRARREELARELSREKRRRELIAEADPAEMEGLYESIEEQGQHLEGIRARNGELEEQVSRVDARLEEANGKRANIESAIAEARAVYEQIKGYTKGEAARLLREVRNLEALHLWRLRDDSADGVLELVHDGVLEVTLRIDEEGHVPSYDLALAPSARQNPVAVWALQVLTEAKERNAGADMVTMMRDIARSWTRTRHVLAAHEHLNTLFPSSLSAAKPGNASMMLQAEVLLVRRRAKLVVSVECAPQSLLDRGAVLDGENVNVQLVYGNVDAAAVTAQIADCLGASTANDSLAKAVLEARATFDA